VLGWGGPAKCEKGRGKDRLSEELRSSGQPRPPKEQGGNEGELKGRDRSPQVVRKGPHKKSYTLKGRTSPRQVN